MGEDILHTRVAQSTEPLEFCLAAFVEFQIIIVERGAAEMVPLLAHIACYPSVFDVFIASTAWVLLTSRIFLRGSLVGRIVCCFFSRPCHQGDLGRHVRETADSRGWYVNSLLLPSA